MGQELENVHDIAWCVMNHMLVPIIVVIIISVIISY